MCWKPRGWVLIGALLFWMTTAGMGQLSTTEVADTVYNADGTAASGTILISWPSFTTGTGQAIPTGSTSVSIGPTGAMAVALTPNAGSNPMGSYYTVIYHLANGSESREFWVVPVSSTAVTISSIRSTVLPASVALQTVSKSYVDTAIAAAVSAHPLDATGYVLAAGDTMTGPLVLPADPVSALQAADKNYVDVSVAAVGGGSGQKVSTLPLATQTVTQPTGTQLDVNLLNGEEYASQFISGRGNNGIANAAAGADCANGCTIKAEPTYTNEQYAASSWNNQTHLQDARGGGSHDSYMNPLDVVNHGISVGQSIDVISTQSEASLYAATGGSRGPGSTAMAVSQEGLAGGSNLFSEGIDNPVPYFKMGYSALSVNGTYNTQGQHVLVPEQTNCYGVGDCLIGARFIYASGGFRDGADEGAHPYDLQTHEDSRVFDGTCVSGCSAGSTNLTVSASSGGGTQGDGRFLIDTNPAKVLTSGSVIGATASPLPHAGALFSGTAFPLSVFLSTGQVIPSQANNQAPGTVTFAIATTGVPTGYATTTGAAPSSTGIACVADQTNGDNPHNYEMAPYTVVDGTHLRMTLNKPHAALATVAMGGLCGYGLEQTVDTVGGIRQVFPVVGSYSATGLYYAGHTTAVIGVGNQTSGFLNVSYVVNTIARSGNLVTMTTNGNFGIDLNGLRVTIAGVADSSYNGTYVVTTTAANTLTYSQSGANSSSAGGTMSVLTGGYALYPMAEVLSVFNQATRLVDGAMTLAPNTVTWAQNDSVEEPHYYEEYVTADTQYLGQTVPRPASQTSGGIQYQQNNGPGLIGWSIDNASPATNYLGYGGTHSFPDVAYEAKGAWLRTMRLGAGEQAVFAITCKTHGCNNWNSGYNLFELNSSVAVDTIGYNPPTSVLSMNFRGAPYSFSPQGFTAGTITVGTLNATSITGALNGVPLNEVTNVPRKPMTTMLQALHNAKNQAVNLVVLSDSFGICDYTNCGVGPTVSTNRYVEQLRINLQAQYGSHGTGMVPLIALVQGPTVNSEAWRLSGGVATTNVLGPYQGAGFSGSSLVHLSNGEVATFTSGIAYDTAVTYCMTNAASGSIAVAIDGVPVGTACGSTTATPTAHAVVSTTQALTTHTTTFTSTGDSYLYAAEGTAGSAGVSVHNLSVGSAAAEWFGLAPGTQLAFSDLIPTGTQGVMTMLQTNEPGVGYSVASFTSAMSSIISHEQGLAGSPSVLMVVPPQDVIAGLAPYTAAQVALAVTQNVAFVNVQDRWGAAYVAGNGLWDMGTVAPGIHPNDKGSLDEYSMVYAQLVDPVPTGGSAGAGGSVGLSTSGFYGPATIAGGVVNIPKYGVTYQPLELNNTAGAASTSDNSAIYYANVAGQVVTLPPSANSMDGTTACAAGIFVCGPTRMVTVYNSSAGSVTVVAPAGWNLEPAAAGVNIPQCVAGVCTITSASSMQFSTFNLGTGTQNWFVTSVSSPSSYGGGCAANCVYTGVQTLTGDSSGTNVGNPLTLTGGSSLGNFELIGGTDSAVHKWGLHSMGSAASSPGSLAFGDFTAGWYAYSVHADSSTTAHLQMGQASSYCWDNSTDGATGSVSACISRPYAGAIAPGTSVGGTNGVYTGPATAPSGSCSTIGWQFSQDGHATFCNGTAWVSKL